VWRRGIAWVLVVLACLSAPLMAVAVWSRATVVETDGWVELVEPLPRDPEVQAAIADELTQVVLDGFGVGGPVRAAAEPIVRRGAERLVRTEAFANLWVTAHREAHERLVQVLREEGTVGEVRVRLLTAVALVIDTLKEPLGRVVELPPIPDLPPDPTDADARAVIEAAFGRSLEPGRGEVELVAVDRLDEARVAFRAIDRGGIALLIGWLVLAGLAVGLAVERFRTGAFLGFGTAVMLLFSWVVAMGVAPALASYAGGSGLARRVSEAAADSAVSSYAGFVIPIAVVAAIAGLGSAVVEAVVARRR
jgi:hypothetical protein